MPLRFASNSAARFSSIVSLDWDAITGKPSGLNFVTNYEPTIISSSSGSVSAGDSVIAVVRAAPTATSISFPDINDPNIAPIRVFDWSSSVVDHAITIDPFSTQTVMRAPTWSIYSNAAQLGSATFYPSTTLNGWYIAP